MNPLSLVLTRAVFGTADEKLDRRTGPDGRPACTTGTRWSWCWACPRRGRRPGARRGRPAPPGRPRATGRRGGCPTSAHRAGSASGRGPWRCPPWTPGRGPRTTRRWGERPAQGGVGRPGSGRLRPGLDVGAQMRRARREIARGGRPAPDPHARIPWGSPRAPTGAAARGRGRMGTRRCGRSSRGRSRPAGGAATGPSAATAAATAAGRRGSRPARRTGWPGACRARA